MDAPELQSPPIPSCYRHPDRETRLSCSSCGRPVCVDCVRQGAVGQKCLECAAPEPGARVYTARDIRSGAGAPASKAILLACGAAFLVVLLNQDWGSRLFEFAEQDNRDVAAGQWYRLLTSAFLHDPYGFTHILFNMWALYMFGPPLEREVGTAPFTALYLASGLAGGAAFYFFGPSVGSAVGASGAIFGLFGAWLADAVHNRHTLAGQANLRQMLLVLGINLALPLLLPRIAWEAHVGGLVAGFVVGWLWLTSAYRDRLAARAVVAAAVGAVALAAVVLA